MSAQSKKCVTSCRADINQTAPTTEFIPGFLLRLHRALPAFNGAGKKTQRGSNQPPMPPYLVHSDAYQRAMSATNAVRRAAICRASTGNKGPNCDFARTRHFLRGTQLFFGDDGKRVQVDYLTFRLISRRTRMEASVDQHGN
jgi:hypothetical protein